MSHLRQLSPKLWGLDIRAVPSCDPCKHGLLLRPIYPLSYYQTSGDAVAKARQLVRDLAELQPLLRPHAQALADGQRSLAAAQQLLAELVELKGGSTHLECSWELDGLVLSHKEPQPGTPEQRRRASRAAAARRRRETLRQADGKD